MKFKFTIPVLVATLAVSGIVAFQTKAQAQYNSNNSSNSAQKQITVFNCVRQGQAFATVAQRGNRRSRPMIIWESYRFGPEYTPQQRCQSVSQKLTDVVAQNRGSLRNLLLTTGDVSGYTVICYVNKTVEARCNNSNTLFTLNPDNAKEPGAALANILRFGVGDAGVSPLRESAGGENTAPEDVAVEMEAVVDQAFAASHESAGGNDSNLIEPSTVEQFNHAPAAQVDSNQGGW